METGEVRQRIDLPENLWNGYGHQPYIFLQLKDRLLVDCRYEPYTRTDIGEDGSPFTTQTEQMYLGLISIDDFLNAFPTIPKSARVPTDFPKGVCMKRFFSLTLAALLLAGMPAARRQPERHVRHARHGGSPCRHDRHNRCPDAAPLLLGDEKQYYMDEMVTGETHPLPGG